MTRKQKHPTRAVINDLILACDHRHDFDNTNVNHVLPNHNRGDNQLIPKTLPNKRRSKRSNSSLCDFITSSSKNIDRESNNPTAVTGRERIFFIERELNKSDMDDGQHRLSMPCNQVRGHGFFTSDETERLKAGSSVAAKMIDPRGEEYEINLNIRKAGPSTYSYAVGKPWNRVKKENGFESGMVLKVWARRGEAGEPCFVLEKSG